MLRELDRMRTLLATRAASRGGFSLRTGERLLVVARFAPGLTLEAWNALTTEEPVATLEALMADAVPHASETLAPETLAPETAETAKTTASSKTTGPWFVLDLDPAQHPQLLGLCQESAHLFHAVCPLTGALLPDPFRAHLAEELHRLADGGELSLIMLELVTPVWMKAPCAHESRAATPHDCTGLGVPFSHTALDFSMSSLARVARAHIRGCDTPGRLTVDRLALVLPGTGPFRARALTERLIGDFCEAIAAEYRLAGHKKAAGEPSDETKSDPQAPPIQIRAGIACCDGEQKLTPEALLGQASTALTLARPGHTRTFRKTGSPERKTQVQACEKQFLFFGDPE